MIWTFEKFLPDKKVIAHNDHSLCMLSPDMSTLTRPVSICSHTGQEHCISVLICYNSPSILSQTISVLLLAVQGFPALSDKSILSRPVFIFLKLLKNFLLSPACSLAIHLLFSSQSLHLSPSCQSSLRSFLLSILPMLI